MQLMAAGESRELVGAARPFAPPQCADALGRHDERGQKAEQQLEHRRGQSNRRLRQVPVALDAASRFTESCKRPPRRAGHHRPVLVLARRESAMIGALVSFNATLDRRREHASRDLPGFGKYRTSGSPSKSSFCCMSAAACSASFSPRCRSTTLKTSSTQTLGTTSRSTASIAAAKFPAPGALAKYSSRAEESTTFGRARDATARSG